MTESSDRPPVHAGRDRVSARCRASCGRRSRAKSSELYEADRVLKFVLPAEQDDIKPVRVPRPLSNLMKGEGCGFKLTGDEVHLTSDRGKELQGLIDDEFRKAALASLKHALDFKIFEVEQHTATLDSMATKLRHSVDALFTGTEIAADVRTARTDAALKAFEVNAAEKLETAEVSRRNAEISKEKEAKRMNDAELEQWRYHEAVGQNGRRHMERPCAMRYLSSRAIRSTYLYVAAGVR